MVSAVDIPESVRSLVQAVGIHDDLPEATDDLRGFIDGLNPSTAPDAADLLDVILLWIATAPPQDPRLPAWTGYARDASRRLHGDDHYRARRAELAGTAVRAGILASGVPDGVPRRQVQDLIRCIACVDEPRVERGTPTSHLSAYLLLHAYGHSEQAITELTRLLRSWQESVDAEAQPTMIVVLTAMLAACGRTHDAARILQHGAGIVGAPGNRLRDLIALSAITITDIIITTAHTPLCTSGLPTPDRHTWSALAHSEDPDRHLCTPPARATPRPVPGPAGTGGPYDLDVTELPERLRNHFAYVPDTTPSNDLTGSAPARTLVDVWLACQDCRLAVLLGQSTVHDAEPDSLITPATIDGVPAWQHPLVGTAIRRMLQDHLGHRLCAITDRSPLWRAVIVPATTFVGRTGGPDAVSHADYVQGWPHQPRLADYRGATPQPVTGTPHDETALLCTWCGLELIVGDDMDNAGIGMVAAVMRLVTDHAGHGLLLADEDQWDDYYRQRGWADTIRSGPDDPWVFGDITRAQFLAGWPDNPRLLRYHGFNPFDPPPAAPPDRAGAGNRPCCTPCNASPSPTTDHQELRRL